MRLKRSGLLRGLKVDRIKAYEDMGKEKPINRVEAVEMIEASEKISIVKIRILEYFYRVRCGGREIYVELKNNSE